MFIYIFNYYAYIDKRVLCSVVCYVVRWLLAFLLCISLLVFFSMLFVFVTFLLACVLRSDGGITNPIFQKLEKGITSNTINGMRGGTSASGL
jgi:hypothetical protein